MAQAEADKVIFELVSPERLLISRAVDMVVVPGEEGDFAVLPGHAPVMSSLRDWVVEIHENGAVSERVFVSGGFAEVTAKRCTVLAEEALAMAEITAEDARARLAAAEQRIEDAANDEARAAAEAEKARAEALIEALAYFAG